MQWPEVQLASKSQNAPLALGLFDGHGPPSLQFEQTHPSSGQGSGLQPGAKRTNVVMKDARNAIEIRDESIRRIMG